MGTAKESVKLGVIGLRNNGRGHAKRAIQVPGLKLIAGADQDKDRVREAQQEFGFAHAYQDARALLANPEVDAVILSLPNHLHASIAIKAMEAGKHVLVEKPMASNIQEAQSMLECRNRTGKVLMIGWNERFSGVAQAIHQRIQNSDLGDVYYIRTRWTRRDSSLGGRGDWCCSKKLAGGGPLVDIGVHKLDLAWHLMGYPEFEGVSSSCFYGIGHTHNQAHAVEYEAEDMNVSLLKFSRATSLLCSNRAFI